MKGCFKSSLEKSSSVIDDAVYHSMQVPSFYKQTRVEVFKERSPVARMHAESEKEKSAKAKKWEKVGGPSPVHYKMAESYDKTQATRAVSMKIIKETKIPKFTEIAANANKWVPPVGTYTVDEKVYAKIISKPKGYK